MTDDDTGGIHVLCVDDDGPFLDLIATYLQRENEDITVTSTTSVSSGREIVTNNNIDCIVSDYDMPEADGIEFLHTIRDQDCDLPFILFTGKGSEEVASEAISAGVSDYLQKTRGTDQYAVLANRIENLVRLHRMETRYGQTGSRKDKAAIDTDEIATIRDSGGEDVSSTDDNPGDRQQAFDALAEASADGIIMLDANSTIRYANPAVERILGYTREELVGSPKMKIIPERLRQMHADALQRYLQSGTKHIDWTYVELPGLHRDGHEVPLAISLNDFTHDGDHYFVGTFRDISARKEAEQELQQQNKRLEDFASIVSHDLQSPLSVAEGRLELAQEECDNEHLGQAMDALNRGQELIEDLLTLAREGKQVDASESVMLADTINACWQTIDTEGATLLIETEQSIVADQSRLRQLLENLARNTIKHGGTNVTVTVGDLEDGFYVADDGPGIPEEEREQVFETGYSTTSEGHGLGLSIVREIADAHGWDITITESESGGAQFEIAGVENTDK